MDFINFQVDCFYWSHICPCHHAYHVSLFWLRNNHYPKGGYLLLVILSFCCIWNQNAQRRMENVSKRKSISTVRKPSPIICLHNYKLFHRKAKKNLTKYKKTCEKRMLKLNLQLAWKLLRVEASQPMCLTRKSPEFSFRCGDMVYI